MRKKGYDKKKDTIFLYSFFILVLLAASAWLHFIIEGLRRLFE